MRVLLVTHYYSTHAGGIEIVAGTLASRLAASHDIAWAASDCDPLPPTPGVRLLPMRSTNLVERVTGLPFPIWGPQSLLRLWRETSAVDLVHLHDLIYLGNWIAFAYARAKRKPVLVTQHAGPIRYRSVVLRSVLRLMHRTVVRALMSRADRVVFISPVVRAYFASFVRFREPPEVIWNGVDTNTYTPASSDDRNAARAGLQLEPDASVVLFVGRFVEAKGLKIIEQLCRRLPQTTWLLAGWGPLDPRAWNAPNVRVYTTLRGSDLVPLYHASDLLVLPSSGEGLPLVVQEAMACGTPVLVDPDTASGVDAPAGTLFACAVGGTATVDNWTTAIREVLARIRSREDLRPAIVQFARTRWSWQVAAVRYSELFAGIPSHRP